ncbi:MAG: hypothetical protein WCK98_03310 [bacterium]
MFTKFKNLLGLSLVLLLSISFFASPIVRAAEFYPKNNENGDNVDIKSTRDNVYATGGTIAVNESIAKDLIAAGGTIEIKGNVGRSLILAGNEINISSNRVGGATRIAAKKVIITGSFGEEVIIAADEVVIKNANIIGDLYVGANKLTIESSNVSGDAKVSYTELNGDLKKQVRGDVQENKRAKTDVKSDFSDAAKLANILGIVAVQFSVIIFLLTVGYILKRKKKLELPEIVFNNKFGVDILIGLGIIIFALPILIITGFLQLYPLTIVLFALLYLSFVLSAFYFPIYLANLIKNTTKIGLKFEYLLIITYLFVAILSLIPFVNVLANLVFFVFQLGNFGFLSRKFVGNVNAGLSGE